MTGIVRTVREDRIEVQVKNGIVGFAMTDETRVRKGKTPLGVSDLVVGARVKVEVSRFSGIEAFTAKKITIEKMPAEGAPKP